jgi:hypothetical protein
MMHLSIVLPENVSHLHIHDIRLMTSGFILAEGKVGRPGKKIFVRMSGNGFQQSYANEKPPSSTGSGEADISTDPASSGFFTTDFKR